MRILWIPLLSAMLVLITTIGLGEEGTQHLQKGIKLLNDLFVDEAIVELEKGLDLGLSDDEKVRCYASLALAHIINGDDDKAVEI